MTVATECWHGFCILTDCDGLHHVDATGYSWEQERGTAYCPEHQAYDRCGDGPVFTDYERYERDSLPPQAKGKARADMEWTGIQLGERRDA